MNDLPAELSPWGDQAWRDSVRAWVRDRLRAAGVRPAGELEPRLRPWSVTGRIRTDRGPVWFKANAPGSRFEPALMAALSRWVPGQVLTPVAIDREHGWSLLPDGGVILGTLPGLDAGSWEEPLRQYAALQRAVSGRVAQMAAFGVPDLRPARLPGHFDALLDSAEVRAQAGATTGMTAAQYAALRALRPALAQWCERLAASAVPPSLDHSDLHDYQVFVTDGRYTFFDWGDASIGHPFTSLLVILRAAAARHGLAAGSAALGRLRDAYLEPWTAELPAHELRRYAKLAIRLGAISRALAWQRAFPQAAAQVRQDQGGAVAYWLTRLLEPDPG
ncbi:MAG TPA: hypothetical protein VGI37_08840 [Streptosporangiaceae bacterium]